MTHHNTELDAYSRAANYLTVGHIYLQPVHTRADRHGHGADARALPAKKGQREAEARALLNNLLALLRPFPTTAPQTGKRSR